MPAIESEERNFLDYIDILFRRKILIVVLVVVAVAASLSLDTFRAKSYGANATMQLVSQNVAEGGSTVELSPTDIATDIQLVQSSGVEAIVAKYLGQAAPPVSVTEVGLTEVLDIEVSSTNRDFAVRAANEYVSAYIQYTTGRFSQQTQQQESALEAQQKSLESEINGIESQIASGGSKNAANSALTTELQVDAAQLEQVNTSINELELEQTEVPSGALSVVPAAASTVVVSPSRVTDAAIAGLIGLIVGIGLALLMDFLDDRIRTKEQLHQVTGSLPLLGEIPEFDNWKNLSGSNIIVAQRPKSGAAEAYRSLRTAIQFIGFDSDKTNVIQITSPLEGEGKTTTVVDLAVTMASSGTRVAILSCDLRRPGLHKYFGAVNIFGLSSVLSGSEAFEDVLMSSSEFPSLTWISSGAIPPNPSELLGSPRLAELLEHLRTTNDVVLVDSPPVLPVTDALVVAQVVDYAILLVRAGQTHARAVTQALELLANVGAPVKGVVLNAVAPAATGGGYGRYGRYGRYGAYGGYGSYGS